MVEYINGRFRAKVVTIKELEDVRIIFWDKETIYLIDKKRNCRYIFHRWFSPRASYGAWNAFRTSLWSSKHNQLGWYFEQAANWEICSTFTTRRLDLNEKEVKYL